MKDDATSLFLDYELIVSNSIITSTPLPDNELFYFKAMKYPFPTA